MRLDVLAALCLGSMLAGTALAQQPAPSPAPAAGPPADYGAPITNEQAKAVAAAAVAEAKKNNWRMAFAIVGPAGELVYFEKMDGTHLASVEIAQANTKMLYVGTEKGGIYKSTDGGNTWSEDLASPVLPGFTITRILTSPTIRLERQSASHIRRSRARRR